MSGWLSPGGIFYPCAFGHHYEKANEILRVLDETRWENFECEPEDELKIDQWCVMGFMPLELESARDSDHLFIPSTGRTQDQIDWFEENYNKLTWRQQELLEKHIDEYLELQKSHQIF